MGYGDEIKDIVDEAVDLAEDTDSFGEVVRGWKDVFSKSPKRASDHLPLCAVVFRNERLESQAGAITESRRSILEFWTMNNEGHDKAIELAGDIIDEMENDLTLDGNVAWSRFEDVEFYINVGDGFNLHWSKVTFELERRRRRA